MNHSEFPAGISAVAASQFGGGQSYFAERQANALKNEERAIQRHPHPEDEDRREEEEQEDSDAESEPKKDTDFEPTYDLSKGVEHHPHLGLLLDVKL